MVSETVMNILREMREFADTDSQTIGRDVLRRQIQNFADRLKAAYKREVGSYKDTIKLWCDRADELRRKCDEQYAELKRYKLADKPVTDCNGLNTKSPENVNSEKVIYNNEKTRKSNDWLSQLVRLINGDVNNYMSQGTDYFSVVCGPWHIKYDNTKGESNE